MSAVARFLTTNLLKASATVLSASSADGAHPVSWLRNPLLAKPWRSRPGWTIITGLNDEITFNRGGDFVAHVAQGYYATGPELAVAVVAAMEAADPTPAWACSYSANKFTISTAAHNFTLTWLTQGTVFSMYPELGFAYADTASAITHTGATAVYQSRHFVGLDFGSALNAYAFVVRKHNVSSSGLVAVGKNDTSVLLAAAVATGFDGLVAEAVLAGTDPRVSFIATGQASKRYWALGINDCGNSVGYAEVGVFFIGAYVLPSITYNSEPRSIEDLSVGSQGASGADYNVERAQRQAWEVMFHAAAAADQALLEALRIAQPGGKCWFFAMDAATNPTTTTRYGYIVRGSWHDEDLGAGQRDYTFTFAEALP